MNKDKTEIDKRIEEAAWHFEGDVNVGRDCYNYNGYSDGLTEGFKAGAKFILDLPEMSEAIEAMEFAAAEDMWESDGEYIESFSYQYKEWYQDKLNQALAKIKALGIVKEGER